MAGTENAEVKKRPERISANMTNLSFNKILDRVFPPEIAFVTVRV